MVRNRTYSPKKILSVLLALVVTINVLLPMYAPLLSGGAYKIPVCTAEGVKYVDAGEVGGGLPQKESNLPHCPLCVLGNTSLLCTPQLGEQTAYLESPRALKSEYADAGIGYFSSVKSHPSAPRAPPSSLL